MSERQRREAAYRQSADAILACVEGEDADLLNLIEAAAAEDARLSALRLASLGARAVEALAILKGESPALVVEGLLDPERASAHADRPFDLSLDEWRWINNALNELVTSPDWISDWDFDVRIGGSRDEVRFLLRRVHDHLRQLAEADPDGRGR